MAREKKENDHFQRDNEMEQEWLEFDQQHGHLFLEYDVEYPTETEILMTIDAVRPYVPVKGAKRKAFFDHVYSIVKQSLREIFYISPLFWASNGFFLLVGILAVLVAKQNPYMVMLLLSPLPAVTGLLEVFKSLNKGMAELEMSFKFSFQELILSKMFIVGVFNLLISGFFTLTVYLFHRDLWILKMLLYWITPFTVSTSLSLLVVSRFRHVYALTGVLVFWIGVGSLIAQPDIFEKIEGVSEIFLLFLTFFASSFAGFQLRKMVQRGIDYDFDN